MGLRYQLMTPRDLRYRFSICLIFNYKVDLWVSVLFNDESRFSLHPDVQSKGLERIMTLSLV